MKPYDLLNLIKYRYPYPIVDKVLAVYPNAPPSLIEELVALHLKVSNPKHREYLYLLASSLNPQVKDSEIIPRLIKLIGIHHPIFFKEEKLGDVEIKKYMVPKNTPIRCGLENITSEQDIWYYSLNNTKGFLMTDEPFELYSHMDILSEFNGKILVAGLGLGLFFSCIKKYELIHVVEPNKNVIDLVSPYFTSYSPKYFNCKIEDFVPEIEYDYVYSDTLEEGCCFTEIPQELRQFYFKKFPTSKVRFWQWHLQL